MGDDSGWISPKRGDRDYKAQKTLGLSSKDLSMARKHSVASTASTQSRQLYSDARGPEHSAARQTDKPYLPPLELKASSILLHEEFMQQDNDSKTRPSMPVRNRTSSSTLHSHYDAQKVPLSISQQTSESSRRDRALRKVSPDVSRFPLSDKSSINTGKSFKLVPGIDRRKLSKQRPRTSEAAVYQKENPDWRPDSGHGSVPSIKSMTHISARPSKSSRLASVKPNVNPRRLTGTTNKSLLEPLDPACVKVNVRRPRIGAKNWFDDLDDDSSDEELHGEPESQQHFFKGLEDAFEREQIRPPSDQSSSHGVGQTFHLSNSSVSTVKPFLTSNSSMEGSPRVAVLSAKKSVASIVSVQQGTPTQTQPATSRKLAPTQKPDLTKDSFLNLSASDDETDDEVSVAEIPAGSLLTHQPAIRDSVALAFNNDSAVELGLAHESVAATSALGPQHARIRTLKVVNRNSRPEQLQMPVPKRGSSLTLTHLATQAERQSVRYDEDDEDDLIPSFPATPIESDHSAYRMSVSIFSDTASVESRRMMSVTKQEESLLAAMRLKKAAMKQNVTRDKRLRALRRLEQGQSLTPPTNQHSSGSSMSSFRPRQPVQPLYGEETDREAISRASGTTFQTQSSNRYSQMTVENKKPLNRLSLSSDGHSASQSMMSLSTDDRRLSRDTFMTGLSPAVHGQGHSRNRTESSHFSHIVELDRVPGSREEIMSQDFIDWPYKGWHNMGVAH